MIKDLNMSICPRCEGGGCVLVPDRNKSVREWIKTCPICHGICTTKEPVNKFGIDLKETAKIYLRTGKDGEYLSGPY